MVGCSIQRVSNLSRGRPYPNWATSWAQEESSRQHHSRSQRSSGPQCPNDIGHFMVVIMILWITLAMMQGFLSFPIIHCWFTISFHESHESRDSWHPESSIAQSTIDERQFSQVKKLEDEMVAVAQQAEAWFWEHGTVLSPCGVWQMVGVVSEYIIYTPRF